jgi:hypothetical protein
LDNKKADHRNKENKKAEILGKLGIKKEIKYIFILFDIELYIRHHLIKLSKVFTAI